MMCAPIAASTSSCPLNARSRLHDAQEPAHCCAAITAPRCCILLNLMRTLPECNVRLGRMVYRCNKRCCYRDTDNIAATQAPQAYVYQCNKLSISIWRAELSAGDTLACWVCCRRVQGLTDCTVQGTHDASYIVKFGMTGQHRSMYTFAH